MTASDYDYDMTEDDYDAYHDNKGAQEHHKEEARIDAMRAQDQGLMLALERITEEDILFKMLDQWQREFAVDIIAAVRIDELDLIPPRRAKIKEILERVRNDSLLKESLDDNMRARGFPG